MARKIILSVLWILCILFTSGSPKGDVVIFEGSEKITLKGDWNLVMGSFLSYKEIINNKHHIVAPVPGTWNNLEWKEKKNGPYGFGTYYKRVVIADGQKIPRLALEVSEISLAYKLFINDELIGQRGEPGTSMNTESPQIDYGIYDFNVNPNDTIFVIFHVSNFSHESGGVWYAPNLGTEKKLRRDHDFSKGVTLLIVGSFVIAGFFQLYVFFRRRDEKFAIYFFLGSVSLIMLTISRGEMLLMDFFPDTGWVTLKRVLYISLFTFGACNGLFLMELFPKYLNKRVVQGMVVIALLATLFTLVAPPRLSYSLVPPYHIYNGIIGTYMLWGLIRAAYWNKFGARFLLVGYGAGFLSAVHDILSTQYVIQGYSFAMIQVGTIVYILQLLAVIAGRYIYALKGKEELSNHLKKVNEELEETIDRRTKALREKNLIIETKNVELEQAMKEKDHLMAVVAHDLKAPFNMIIGFSELMDDKIQGKSAEFNEMIKKVSHDGRKLIEHLTELKTYEQDDFTVDKEVIDIESFFEEKCLSFSKLAEEKKIAFQSSLEKACESTHCNQSLLGRIVDNLLSNAIKFTSPKDTVEFNVIVTNSKIELKVRDTGPGFSEKDQELVFEKFQKLSARPTAGESSTGLGLSIVKILTEKLNGSINLISEHGKGSELTVTLPNS